MPNIQTDRIQSVTPDGALPYQSIQGATPEAFGAGVGASLQQAGDTSSEILLRRQAIVNETARVGAENSLMAATQDLQNGNQDKGIVGYRTLMGSNAVNALPDYQQKVQDAYQSIRDNLSPAVARQFDQSAFRIVRGTTDGMGQWSSQQAVVGLHAAARDRVQLAQSGALTYADDPDGWNKHLSDVQEASLDSSRTLGLGADATEVQRQNDVSAVFENRTKQLLVRDPMEARDFYQRNIGSVVPQQRWELERALKVGTDALYARSDGTDAYHAAIGRPSAAPVPANLGAPYVKPLDDARMQEVTSFVKGKTPWDDAINAAAQAHNVNPYEIKLKIAMESGGDPKAVNSTTGATGLGQFTAETATRLGITDRTDPQQSIDGIAKLLAGSGGTTGGDMAGADRAYYSGSTTGKGPNTDQYVENTRAARQQLFGGGAPAPLTISQLRSSEGDVITQAQAQAQQRRPGDVVYRDQVVGEARRAWSLDLAGLEGKEYQSYGSLMSASIGDNGARAASDLNPDQQQTFAGLTPEHQEALQRLWLSNQNRDERTVSPEDTRNYLALMGQARTDPVAFKARDIATDVAGLPKQYQSQVISAYTNIDKNDAKAASYQHALSIAEAYAMKPAGIFTPTKDTPDEKRKDYDAYTGALAGAMDNFTNANKRSPTDKELIDMTRGLTSTVQVPGNWYGHSDLPAFKLTGANIGSATAAVPDAFRTGITNALKARGQPASEAQVQAAFMMHLRPDLVGQPAGASGAPPAPAPAAPAAPTPPAAAAPGAPPITPDDSPAAAFARSRARMEQLERDRERADAPKPAGGHYEQASVGVTTRWVPDGKGN